MSARLDFVFLSGFSAFASFVSAGLSASPAWSVAFAVVVALVVCLVPALRSSSSPSRFAGLSRRPLLVCAVGRVFCLCRLALGGVVC